MERVNYSDIRRYINSAWTIVILTAVAAAAAWWHAWFIMPPFNDDITYSYYFAHPHKGFLQDIIAEVRCRYSTDNIRLGNMLYLLIIPLGRGFGASVAALAVLLTACLMWKSAGVFRRPAIGAFGLAAYMMALPWYECMSVLDFAFNYVLGACVLVWFFYLFFARKCSAFLFAVVALMTGMWHEGFSIPLFCGVGMWLILHLRSASAKQWTMWLLLLPGILLLITSPGLIGRTGAGPHLSSLLEPFYYRKFFLTMVYFGMLVCTVAIPRFRKMVSSSHVVIVVLCLAVIVIRTVQTDISRPVWAAETMAIVGVMLLLKGILPSVPRWMSVVMSTIICGVLVVHLSAFVSQTTQTVREYHEIDEAYRQSADGLVFYDHTLDYQSHPLALKRPELDHHYNQWARWSYDIHASGARKRLRVIPTALRDVDIHPGERSDSDLYIKGGYIYSPANRFSCAENPQLLMLTTDNTTLGAEVEMMEFTSCRGGRYVYYKPKNLFRVLHGHPILHATYYK